MINLKEKKSKDYKEIEIQQQWNQVAYGTCFKTEKGQSVIIESCGIWNTEKGPDFLNARIVLDGKQCIGDIEIHRKASDWYGHNHDSNPWYDKVILHIVSEKPTDRAPDLPTIVLPLNAQKENDRKIEIVPGVCAEQNLYKSDAHITEVLELCGLERFILKSELIARSILMYGKEYTAMFLLFDAAGYKNNRDAFKSLFDLFQQHDSEEQKNNTSALLWGESGLLPDLVIEEKVHELFYDFVKKNHVEFGSKRNFHQSPPLFSRSGGRPSNSPERRLAALVKMLNECNCAPFHVWETMLLGYETPLAYIETLLKSLVISDPLFDQFWNFKTKSTQRITLQGELRALDIALNVVIPVLYADAMIEKNDQRVAFLKRVYLQLPASQQNHILQTAVEKCFGKTQEKRAQRLLKNSVYQQGLIHLFSYFCDENQSVCHTCKMLHADL